MMSLIHSDDLHLPLSSPGHAVGWWWAKMALRAGALLVGGLFFVMVGFVFFKSLPFLARAGIGVLYGMQWSPRTGLYGILPLIWGSWYVAAMTLALAIPWGMGVGIFLFVYCPARLKGTFQATVYLLANIPPVVYGFVGIVLVLPQLRARFGGTGYSILAAAMMLTVLITPTIAIATYTALCAVPQEYYEGALALGADKNGAIRRVLLPVAWPGIMAGALLGLGRAMGETMIVLMVGGNVIGMPLSPLAPIRTLTSNIALEMAYAAGDHRRALFACGLVLLALVMGVDLVVMGLLRRSMRLQAYRDFYGALSPSPRTSVGGMLDV